MTLEEKLHKEFDWLNVKHVDPSKAIEEIVTLHKSICQEAVDQAKPKWINVKDRLPKYGERVILLTNNKDVICGYLIKTDHLGHQWDIYVSNPNYAGYSHIFHWMPLPESPELKEKL